jgi:hypothetical protein
MTAMSNHHLTLIDLLDRNARSYQDSPALIFEGRSATHAALYEAVQIQAAALHAAGVRRGDRVLLLSGNRPEVLVVLGAVVACRRATPPAETTTTADPPAATGPVRPAGCDAPREGESLAEFDARCRAGAQAAGSDCDVPKEDESFDAFQRRCARRARVLGAARPTMPTAPVVPGVSDAGSVDAAADASARDFTVSLSFRGSPTPES